jgi:hypothetical protein
MLLFAQLFLGFVHPTIALGSGRRCLREIERVLVALVRAFGITGLRQRLG